MFWCCPEKFQFGVVRTSVSLVLPGQVSVWCCPDNMSVWCCPGKRQFPVVRTTSVSLVFRITIVSLVLPGQVLVWCCPDNKC